MTPTELTLLLERCEAGTADVSELESLRLVLDSQELVPGRGMGLLAQAVHHESQVEVLRPGPAEDVLRQVVPADAAWHASLCQGLRDGLPSFERPEITRRVLAEVAPEALEMDPLFDAARARLQAEAADFDAVPGVMNAILSEEAPLVDLALLTEAGEGLSALAAGLADESFGVDVVDSVMAALQTAPEVAPGDAMLDRAFRALARGLVQESQGFEACQDVMARLETPDPLAQALGALRHELALESRELDLSDGIMAHVAPQDGAELEDAFLALRAGLDAAAVGFDVGDVVMHRVAEELGDEVQLSALVDGELGAEARASIQARLLSDRTLRTRFNDYAALGQDLRQALKAQVASHPVSLWPAVSRELGLDSPLDASLAELREGLQAEALRVDLADAIMASVLPPPPRVVPLEASEPVPMAQPERRPAPWFKSLPILSFVLGAAAVVAMVGTQVGDHSGESQGQGELAEASNVFQIGDVNTTEIEDLTVGGEAMVQVFQLEEGAPMIIFIEEPTDPGGVTL